MLLDREIYILRDLIIYELNLFYNMDYLLMI